MYTILVGKPKRKNLLGMSKCRQKGDIRMALKEIRWEDVDWIRIAVQGQEQLRGYASCMNTYSLVPLAGTESCRYVVTLIYNIYRVEERKRVLFT
jgi:hypothetical protein